MPKPPSDKELTLYQNPNKIFLYSFGIFSTALLITGGFLFATQRPWLGFWWFSAFVTLNAFYLGVSYLVGLMAKPFQVENHWNLVRDNKDFLPSVDVYLPTCGEPLEILANAYNYVSQLEWPKMRVYVLDDSARVEVCTMAMEKGFTYWSRPNRGVLKKSGNVRSLFPQTEGEFILILDADFTPRKDLLKNMIPYFKDKKLAILQTPQFFTVEKSMNWVQRGASTIQELFYRLIQVNRDHYGAAICVGTNAVYRRKALEPMGGSYPIEHSEDVHTGFWCLTKGWRVRYVPINLSAGVCPNSVKAFLMQQYRWCSGSTSLFLNRKFFWKAKLTIMQRLSFLSGMLYYQATALGVFFTPLPGILMAWFAPENIFWFNYFFSIPSFVFGTLHMKMWNKQPYGIFAVRARAVSYWAHAFALWDRLTGSVVSWVPTNAKIDRNSVYARFKIIMPTWTIATLALGFSGIVVNGSPNKIWDYAPFVFISIFYGIINISCLWGNHETTEKL